MSEQDKLRKYIKAQEKIIIKSNSNKEYGIAAACAVGNAMAEKLIIAFDRLDAIEERMEKDEMSKMSS
jgi:hypothetical protein